MSKTHDRVFSVIFIIWFSVTFHDKRVIDFVYFYVCSSPWFPHLHSEINWVNPINTKDRTVDT